MQNLGKFNDWSQDNNGYSAKRSAQSYMAGLQGTRDDGTFGFSYWTGNDKKLAPKPSSCCGG